VPSDAGNKPTVYNSFDSKSIGIGVPFQCSPQQRPVRAIMYVFGQSHRRFLQTSETRLFVNLKAIMTGLGDLVEDNSSSGS